MLTRRKVAMIMAEFLGTAVLTLIVITVSKSTIGIPYFVALAAGLTIVGMAAVFAPVSGAHFNPAITIGLWAARRVKTLPTIVYVAAQLLGGAAAYLLYSYFIDVTWKNMGGEFDGRILAAETAGAFVFALGWAAVVYRKYEGARAAAVIGASLVLGILVASAASAAFLNPAVALGARSWALGTYVLGPILGAVIAFNLYGLLFAPAGEAKAALASSDSSSSVVKSDRPKAKKKR